MKNGVFDGLRGGCTVALSDGCDIPKELCAQLSDAARAAGDVRLILGWCLELPDTLDLTAFADVRTFFAGNALRAAVSAGVVKYVGVSYSALPAMFETVWRPDVLVCTSRPGRAGPTLGTQVGWIPSAARAAGRVVALMNHGSPHATQVDSFDGVDVDIAWECDTEPTSVPPSRSDSVSQAIGRNVASLVPEGAAIQYGPGMLGKAVVDKLDTPVHVISGVISDSVVDLDMRGLLLSDPVGSYLAGTTRLYEWAQGKGILAGPEHTHDAKTLIDAGIIAINSALEVDLVGQVNVEFAGRRPVAALGGHADFASAATTSVRGRSVIALPSERNGQSTLVPTLRTPTSTARSNVEFVVTEHGIADLRGTDDAERADRLRPLWPASAV